MKINLINSLYLLILLTFLSASAQAQVDRKVAVFDPAGTVDKSLLEIVREEISSAVVNTKGYTVLERQLINKVLEENKFQESGLVSDAQVSDIGKLMGADYVFVSTISSLGNNYYISCKMIEVATARIDRQFTGTTKNGMNDIPQTIQSVVKRMFDANVTQQTTQRKGKQTDEQEAKPQKTTQSEETGALPVSSRQPYPKRKGYVGVALGILQNNDNDGLLMGVNTGYLFTNNIGVAFSYLNSRAFDRFHSFSIGPFYSLFLNKNNTLNIDLSPRIGYSLIRDHFIFDGNSNFSGFCYGLNASLKWRLNTDFSLSVNMDINDINGETFVGFSLGANYHF